MSGLATGDRRAVEVAGGRAPTAAAACAMLEQCASFVRLLTDEAYMRPSARMFGSTVGQHVRHALDHFESACAGLEGETIVYDRRARGTAVETSREAALELIGRLTGRIGGVGVSQASRPVLVEVMLSAGGDEARLESTLARELAFASHHAIHHHAMMASLGLEMGVSCPAGFGKAPATLHHEGGGRRS